MALKLGEILLQEGLITSSQLEEALKYQVIFGGKLGTNLIEMGVLEEDDVAKALGKKFGVPTVTVEEVMEAPQAALSALPREIVERYGVIPIKLEGRRLTLLMADPSDLKLIEDIGFRSSLIVKPVVAAEVRLVLALEKLYGIERDRRYIHVAKKVVSKRKAVEAAKAAPPTEPPPTPSIAPPAAVELPPVEVMELTEADLQEEEIFEEIAPLEEVHDHETLSHWLAEARDRDDVLDSLASFLLHQFPRSALFLVRGEIAHGWKGSIKQKAIPNFSQVQIPLEEPSVLKTVAESRSFYLGPIPRAPFNSMFLAEIGGRVPEAALLVPVLMMGRVIGIIYVDAKGEDLAERLFELQKLTAKAAMAFEILVLKNKILSM